MSSNRIFIAYRHEDEAHAGRVFDHLAREFGEGRVFRDFDDSSWSTVPELRQIVAKSAAVVAIVGPGWIERIADLSNENDPLAAELEEALSNGAISLIPVTVGGARMPRAEELPDHLAEFPDYRAVALYPQYLSAGLADLTERLRTQLPNDDAAQESMAPPAKTRPAPELDGRRTRWWSWPILIAAFVGVAVYAASQMDIWNSTPRQPPVTEDNTSARNGSTGTDTTTGETRPGPDVGAKGPWLSLAESELKLWNETFVDETTRRGAKRVSDYFTATGFTPDGADVAPWAGAFVAWVMEKSGYELPPNPSAASGWLKFGVELDSPRRGAIAVLARRGQSTPSHVGFYVGHTEEGDRVWILGGNQSDTVKLASIEENRVLSYRWPG